jgi:hypothetical protein
VAQTRRCRYVGPDEFRDQVVAGKAVALEAPAALGDWLGGLDREERSGPFTFVVALDGMLRLGPSRSERVVLAGGRNVLAAGELRFVLVEPGWRVAEATNQSTEYCLDPDCWPAVG